MTQFGQAQEAGEGTVRKLYTGVENFKVVDVNPDHEGLKKIFGENAKEDEYIGLDDEGKTRLKIVMYLDNEDTETPIKTRLTFWVTQDYRLKTDKTKAQVINLYGRTCWLTEAEIATNAPSYTMTGAKGAYHYDAAGSRKAFKGEEGVISMLRNLLNLGSPEKADDKSTVTSQFSEADWNTMFSGAITTLKGVIMSSPNKIGLLLGVKTTDSGVYQDVYNRNTLRQYSKAGGNFNYLRKDVQDAQSNGAFPNTNFGDISFKLSEYFEGAAPTAPAAIEGAASPGFSASTQTAFTSK